MKKKKRKKNIFIENMASLALTKAEQQRARKPGIQVIVIKFQNIVTARLNFNMSWQWLDNGGLNMKEVDFSI